MKSLDWMTVNQVTSFLLILTRISGVFLISPLLSNRSVPNRVKIPIVLMMAVLLFPVIGVTKSIQFTNHISLLVAIIQELTIGIIIGFVASFVFSTVQSAGEIFGMQIGYSIATILDPTTESDSGVITTLYIVMAALFFLYLDGHHLILTSVTKSFEMLPLGGGFSLKIGQSLSLMVERLLVLSIQISAPVLVVITVLNLIFGLLTKLSPQMNIYFNIGFIVGPIVGIGVLILSMPLFRIIMMNMTQELGPELLRTVRELKGS